LSNWQKNHNVELRHKLHSPTCGLRFDEIKNQRPPPNDLSPPNINDMNTYHKRLETFEFWPQVLTQKSQKLAQSGFFATGRSDSVKCHCCGVKLHEWFENENIDLAHYQWSRGRCPFNVKNMRALGYKFN